MGDVGPRRVGLGVSEAHGHGYGGQPEVEHFDATLRGNFDIGGLQVAVNNALVVRGFERLRNLDRQ